MSLGNCNRGEPLAVIDRNDDSASRPIRVAVVGPAVLFVDAIINALLGSRISAWRVGRDLPPMELLDLIEEQQPELVLCSIGMVDDNTAVHRLIGHLTQRKLPVVVLNASSDAALARRWIDAGAVAVVDPASAEFDELATAVRMAAGRDASPAGDWRRRLDEVRRSAQARLRDLDADPIINIDDARA
jgi:DNA-binding NarL/FixJ family response regulator